MDDIDVKCYGDISIEIIDDVNITIMSNFDGMIDFNITWHFHIKL